MSDASEPGLTEDGRWIVVNGRRWRATDPGIAPQFRQELVDELMSARRAVGAAKRAADVTAEQAARRRVQRAKVALGERGAPWWETPDTDQQRDRLEAVVMALAVHRAPTATICPSDAARAIGGTGWRSLLDPVRDAARSLARAGEIEVLQRGEGLDPDQPWRGPIRIRALTP